MFKNRTAYSVNTKNKAVEMKLQGYSRKQVMLEVNKTQVETRYRWYKNRETYRFHQLHKR